MSLWERQRGSFMGKRNLMGSSLKLPSAGTSTRPMSSILLRLLSEEGRPQLPFDGLALACMVATAVATGLVAYVIKDLINGVFVERNLQAIYWIGAGIVAIYVVKGLAAYSQERIMARIGQRIVGRMQKKVFAH
jgi:ATP-binding cassette, subfamily B, bacterial MsbA